MPKSDDERTLDVIEDWCGVAPRPLTKELINLWEETRNNASRPHTSIDFQPDGVENLIEKLKREFQNAPARRITLAPRSFDPNGRVKTVSDLMDAVASSAPVDEVPEGFAVEAFATVPAAVDDETQRLFGVVQRWAGDQPVHVLEPLIEVWERTRASAVNPHKKVPFQPKGITRLTKELAREYKRGTIPENSRFSPDGPIADCVTLLRALHSPSDRPALNTRAAKRSKPKKGA